MAASGDFVTPRLNGIGYFEKPPMQYWASAISFKLFGLSEWSAALHDALWAGVAHASRLLRATVLRRRHGTSPLRSLASRPISPR